MPLFASIRTLKVFSIFCSQTDSQSIASIASLHDPFYLLCRHDSSLPTHLFLWFTSDGSRLFCTSWASSPSFNIGLGLKLFFKLLDCRWFLIVLLGTLYLSAALYVLKTASIRLSSDHNAHLGGIVTVSTENIDK